MLPEMLLLSLMLCNSEELARLTQHGTGEYAKGRTGQALLTYNRASKEKTLWRGPAYETRNPEKVQDSCARKFPA